MVYITWLLWIDSNERHAWERTSTASSKAFDDYFYCVQASSLRYRTEYSEQADAKSSEGMTTL